MRRLAACAVPVLALASPLRAESRIPVVDLAGMVHAVSARHVISALAQADADGVPLVVVRVDTPGGSQIAMRQIIDSMLSCRTPVAVFVAPSGASATSAGFVILVSADIAAMAPGTNAGAAHPVSVLVPMDETMSKKATSDAAAYIRSKVERRGRNVEMAEKAVVESRSFTEKEALDAKLIDLIAPDLPALLTALDGREITRFDGTHVRLALKGHAVVPVRMRWHQAILLAIAQPDILFLLLLGTLAGLGTEISHPGLVFPGIIGALCLILFLFAIQIIPINWAGVLLIMLAVGLFIAEVKVTSYGLLTVGGLVSMILGAMMLVDSDVPGLRIGWGTALPAAAVTAAWTIGLVTLVVRARRRRATTGQEGLLGQSGVAETDVAEEGWVIVQGERWRAVAEEPVRAGERVVVAGVAGLTLRIRRNVP